MWVIFPYLHCVVPAPRVRDGANESRLLISTLPLFFLQISQHALNSLFALLEIILPRTSPPPPLHIVFLIVLLACYLALAYITHSTEGFYPYSFLDTSKGSGRVAGYCFGILAAICVIFGIVWGLIWLREFVTTRKLGLDGKFARQRRKANGPGVRERDVELVELQEEPK